MRLGRARVILEAIHQAMISEMKRDLAKPSRAHPSLQLNAALSSKRKSSVIAMHSLERGPMSESCVLRDSWHDLIKRISRACSGVPKDGASLL
jgi:hypothetical protein